MILVGVILVVIIIGKFCRDVHSLDYNSLGFFISSSTYLDLSCKSEFFFILLYHQIYSFILIFETILTLSHGNDPICMVKDIW